MNLRVGLVAALAATLSLAACSGIGGGGNDTESAVARRIDVTITGGGQRHVFSVEVARTEAEQKTGLMFRTDIGPDQGMLFYPYPPDGGPPRMANFWMKNTPTPLDIIFIRPDGTIATIAENTAPFSETPIPSGEPVGAVLEVTGGRTSALNISPGDKVDWPGRKATP